MREIFSTDHKECKMLNALFFSLFAFDMTNHDVGYWRISVRQRIQFVVSMLSCQWFVICVRIMEFKNFKSASHVANAKCAEKEKKKHPNKLRQLRK